MAASAPSARQQFRAVPLDRRAMAADGRRAVKAWRDLADPAFRSATAQFRQGEPGVAVLGARVHPIDADM